MERIPELKILGRSGCSVEVINHGSQFLVRKTSTKLGYNPRIKNQYEKQIQFFNDQLIPSIKTPKVVSSGYETQNGMFYFEMQYIAGESYREYFLNSTISDLKRVIELVIAFVLTEVENSKIEYIPKETITKKVGAIKLELNPTVNYPILQQYLEILENEIPLTPLPIGNCHGDLTLSNIIFTKKNLFFLDFLDSFINTPLIDVVKIRQDTKFLWSLMLESNIPTYQRNKVLQALRYFDHELEKCFKGKDYYQEWYYYLEIFNLLRIMPYLHKQNEIEFIVNCLKKVAEV